MSKYFYHFIFLLCLVVSSFSFSDAFSDDENLQGSIEVNLSAIPEGSKGMLVFIYRNKNSFLKTPDERFYIPLEQIKDKQFVLENIRHGDMALSVIADLNGNQELDTKIFGIPAEPVGFAGNPKPRFGPPKFDQCVFNFKDASQSFLINLVSI